ncbi:hypothetical protein ACFQX4_15960 [Roseomonas sp. GCM10028921]
MPLGEWILIRPCKDTVTWPGAPEVAVNLPPTQFTSRGLVDAVVSALELPCPAGEIRQVLERLRRDASVPAG